MNKMFTVCRSCLHAVYQSKQRNKHKSGAPSKQTNKQIIYMQKYLQPDPVQSSHDYFFVQVYKYLITAKYCKLKYIYLPKNLYNRKVPRSRANSVYCTGRRS